MTSTHDGTDGAQLCSRSLIELLRAPPDTVQLNGASAVDDIKMNCYQLHKIRCISSNKAIMDYLETACILRPLHAMEFYTDPKELYFSGGQLSVSTLHVLSEAKEVLLSSSGMFQVTCAKLDDTAREFVQYVFLVCMCTIGTIAQWAPSKQLMPWLAADLVNEFNGKSWCTSRMRPQTGVHSHRHNMVQGWRLAEQVLRIQVDDMASSIRHPGREGQINIAVVKEEVPHWIRFLVEEFAAWMFLQVPRAHSLPCYVDEIFAAMSRMHRALCCMFVDASESNALQRSSFVQAISRVVNDEPAMSEVVMDLTTMRPQLIKDSHPSNARRPSLRTFDVMRFLHRCRRHPLHEVTARFHSPLIADCEDNNSSDDDELPLKRAHVTNGNSTPKKRKSDVLDGCPNWVRMAAFQPQAAIPELGTHQILEDTTANVEKDYMRDHADSDNEVEYVSNMQDITDTADDHCDIGPALEELYTEVCRWAVHPTGRVDDGNILTQNGQWLHWCLREGYGRDLLSNINRATCTGHYICHWKSFIIMNLRAALASEMQENEALLTLRKDLPTFLSNAFATARHETPFIRLGITKRARTRTLVHMRTTSNDVALNRTLVDNVMGGMLSIAFFVRQAQGKTTHKTGLMFVICRSVALDCEDIDRVGTCHDVDRVRLRMSASRSALQKHNFEVQPEDELYILPIYGLAPDLRMYKAVHQINVLPDYTRGLMFGPSPHPFRYCINDTFVPPSSSMFAGISPFRDGMSDTEVGNMLQQQVDPASLEYLMKCARNPHINCDHTQFNTILTSLRVVGRCQPSTAGCALIQGPPGTGKTTAIQLIVGALIHHSRYGHVGRKQQNMLGTKDKILRSSHDGDSIKIIVHSATNTAVDNCMQRFVDHGVPDGNGGRIDISMMRIGKMNYEYGRLSRFSVHNLSKPFNKLFHPDDYEARAYPSLKSRRAAAKEAIIFFVTSSTCGGSAFKELRVDADVFIEDEAGSNLEPNSIVPLVRTYSYSKKKRIYQFLIGDPRQLPAFSNLSVLCNNTGLKMLCDAETLTTSLLQRLQEGGRAAQTMLTAQWRMSHTISKIISVPFYACLFRNSCDEHTFHTSYNQPDVYNRGYSPLTFLDTSRFKDRLETNAGEGRISNSREVKHVLHILDALLRCEHFSTYRNEIAIISPYKAQVALLEEAVEKHLAARLGQSEYKRLRICVSTVDAMQGQERSVVILSCVRSNVYGDLGFLRDWRRINVSVSRALNLLVIVGDGTLLYKQRSLGFILYCARIARYGSLFLRPFPETGNESEYCQREAFNPEAFEEQISDMLRVDHTKNFQNDNFLPLLNRLLRPNLHQH